MMTQPIGLLGGTFDPIHNGHLALASYVLQTFALQSVHFIPANQPPHRDAPLASSDDRVAMLKLAIEDYPQYVLNGIELRRAGPSYMIDTLIELKKTLEEVPLCLILGADAFVNLNQWHQWERILDYAHIIVIARSGTDLKKANWLRAWLPRYQVGDKAALQTKSAGRVYVDTQELTAISATALRQKLQQDESVESMLPVAVLDYISNKKLY